MKVVVQVGQRPEAAGEEEEESLLQLGRRKESTLVKIRPVFFQATSLEIISSSSDRVYS